MKSSYQKEVITWHCCYLAKDQVFALCKHDHPDYEEAMACLLLERINDIRNPNITIVKVTDRIMRMTVDVKCYALDRQSTQLNDAPLVDTLPFVSFVEQAIDAADLSILQIEEVINRKGGAS